MSEFIECNKLGVIKKETVDAVLKDNIDSYYFKIHLSRLIIKFTDRRTVVFDYNSDSERDEVYNELVSKLYKEKHK